MNSNVVKVFESLANRHCDAGAYPQCRQAYTLWVNATGINKTNASLLTKFTSNSAYYIAGRIALASISAADRQSEPQETVSSLKTVNKYLTGHFGKYFASDEGSMFVDGKPAMQVPALDASLLVRLITSCELVRRRIEQGACTSICI